MKKFSPFVLLKNISINYLTQIFLLLLSLISIPIFINKLGFEQYGLFILINTFLNYINVINSGINTALIKYLTEATSFNNKNIISDYISSGLFINILLGIIEGVLLIIGSIFFIRISNNFNLNLINIYYHSIYICALILLIYSVGDTFWTQLIAIQKFEYANIKELLIGGIQLLGGIVLIYNNGSILSLFYLKLIITLLYLSIFYIISKKILSFKFSFVLKKNLIILFKFGIFKTLFEITNQFIFNLDKLFLSIYFPISQLPYYSIPLSIVQRVTFITMNFTPPTFPMLVQLRVGYNLEKAKKGYLYISKALNILIIFFFTFICFNSKKILTILINNDFANKSNLILSIISLAYLIFSFAALPTVYFESKGKPLIPFVFSILTLLIQIPLFIFLILSLAGIGTSISLLISAFIIVSIFNIF